MKENMSFRIIDRSEYQEIHFQVIPSHDDTHVMFSEKIAKFLSRFNSRVIRATFFGDLTEEENTINSIIKALKDTDFPYSWIEGGNCSEAFINGVYILAVSGIEAKGISDHGRIIGCSFRTTDADYFYLSGLLSDPDLSPAQQTSHILRSVETILNRIGLSYHNTVRTWFYLDDILAWYNDFNLARTKFFSEHNIFNVLLPASTGIEGKNNSGSKVCLELNAINPQSGDFRIAEVNSLLNLSKK